MTPMQATDRINENLVRRGFVIDDQLGDALQTTLESLADEDHALAYLEALSDAIIATCRQARYGY